MFHTAKLEHFEKGSMNAGETPKAKSLKHETRAETWRL